LPLLAALWDHPGRTREEEGQYVGDQRLPRPVAGVEKVVVQPLWQALELVAAEARVGLVAVGGLLGRPLPRGIPLRTARDVLEAVEFRTAGRWRPVGDIYALQQDPRIERLTGLEDFYKAGLTPRQFAAFQQGLGEANRRRLNELGTLSIAALGRREQAELAQAAALAFVNRPNVAHRALSLRDITIRLLPADPERKLPERVEYRLPLVGDEPWKAIEIPWREPLPPEPPPFSPRPAPKPGGTGNTRP